MSDAPAVSSRPIASRNHTILLLAIVALWAWAGAIGAARIRAHAGHSLIAMYLEAAGFEWLITAYVVTGVRRHGGSLRDLIGGSWARAWDFWRDVLVGIGFWILSLVCLGTLGFALRLKGSTDAVRFLAPHTRVETILWILVSLTAGFCEETLFRGYLQRQFLAWTGHPIWAILLSAAVFGGVHAYQGAKRTLIIGVFGAMFGILAHRRRSLRPGMMVHAWHDALGGLALRFVPK